VRCGFLVQAQFGFQRRAAYRAPLAYPFGIYPRRRHRIVVFADPPPSLPLPRTRKSLPARDAAPRRPAGDAPERWAVDAGTADLAALHIPADASRRRVFDIDVRFVVRATAAADDDSPWHAMTVEIDGAREWSRRIDTDRLGPSDSLDHHCRRDVGVGQALRVRVLTQLSGAQRVRLSIEAEEHPTS
jgi:hypothetical protein